MSNIKEYFTPKEAIRMIPLIKSYCKSLEHGHYYINKMAKIQNMTINLTSLSNKKRQKIKELMKTAHYKLEYYMNKLKEWVKELKNMGLSICSLKAGCIDIPIYDDEMKCIIMICINSKTNKKIVWHLPEENYIVARPYWRSK